MPEKNKRLEQIKKKIAEWEKETPYNFCDRWCKRCTHEKQMRCKLYLDELEQKLTCIAHGREEDDSEITEQVMKQQFEDLEDAIDGAFEEFEEGHEINLDEIDDPEFERIKEHIKFVENNPLPKTVDQYRKKAYLFLKHTFYEQGKSDSKLHYHFETVSWYHTLLPAKLQRALAGFHEPATEGDVALFDAVAQFEVCKKAIRESIKALRKINQHLPNRQLQILELLALLHNIYSRIASLEESV